MHFIWSSSTSPLSYLHVVTTLFVVVAFFIIHFVPFALCPNNKRILIIWCAYTFKFNSNGNLSCDPFHMELKSYQLNSACCHCVWEKLGYANQMGNRKVMKSLPNDGMGECFEQQGWNNCDTFMWSITYSLCLHALPAAAKVRVRIGARKQMLQFVMYEKP